MVEILDFGYPQNSDIDALKMYITTESIKSERAVVLLFQLIGANNTVERGLVEDNYTGHWSHVISTQ
jgi:hypothetical protein